MLSDNRAARFSIDQVRSLQPMTNVRIRRIALSLVVPQSCEQGQAPAGAINVETFGNVFTLALDFE